MDDVGVFHFALFALQKIFCTKRTLGSFPRTVHYVFSKGIVRVFVYVSKNDLKQFAIFRRFLDLHGMFVLIFHGFGANCLAFIIES